MIEACVAALQLVAALSAFPHAQLLQLSNADVFLTLLPLAVKVVRGKT